MKPVRKNKRDLTHRDIVPLKRQIRELAKVVSSHNKLLFALHAKLSRLEVEMNKDIQ